MDVRRELKFTPGTESKHDVNFQSTYAVLLSKFKVGDLVYGIKAVRARAVEQLTQSGYEHCFANTLNNKTVTLVLKGEKPNLLSNIKQEHHEFLNKHLTYLNKPSGKPVPGLNHKGEIRSAAYRRACKLLLVDDAIDRTRTVHVMTEDLDWQRICTKTYQDASNTQKPDLSVTSSEMRAAYRYFRDHGKNHPHIIFYDKNGNVMDKHPWEQPDLIPLFQTYDRTHQGKIEAEEALTPVLSGEDTEEETEVSTPITPPPKCR